MAASALGAGSHLVGMYVYAPGSISACAPWPAGLATNPNYAGGQTYTTDTAAYMSYVLDDTAAMGVDFLLVDESNGIHYGCPPLQSTLLQLLDIADARIRSGVVTPHVAIMSPMPGTPGGAANDADWVYANLVHDPNTGAARPSWVWMSGRPLWGIYTANPFRADYDDARFFIRHVCNGANNECHQKQVDLGTVWPWSSMGQSTPLASAHSNEVTIQNGYQDVIPCNDYWHNCVGYEVGFTTPYYDAQWGFAKSHGPEIVLASAYDSIEGGWIQSRADFNPPTAFVDRTRIHVNAYKGSLALANLGPPPPPPAPQPPGACGWLQPGQGLVQGQSLASCSGRFRLVMQGDGNAVLYEGNGALWQTATEGAPGAGGAEISMQPDGNLVVYSSSGNPDWNSKTEGHGGAAFAVQDDGNLVIYANGAPIWQSHTEQPPPPPPPPPCGGLASGQKLVQGQSVSSCDGRFNLVMQGDGNVVLYQGAAALWQTATEGTSGAGGVEVIMQPDGNLVVYSGNGHADWNSQTEGHPGATFAVQDDSNLVIYFNGAPIWHR